jgi:amidase
MIFNEYGQYDGLGLAELVRRKEISPTALIDTAIDAISRLNPKLNCVVQTLRKQAISDLKVAPMSSPFYGVPFLVKEFGMHFKGMQTSAGSRLASGVKFQSDTELMTRCRNAGLLTVGTTTTPEMAFNANSEALAYGSTCNPWNLNYSVGGSSGGAGAAVASGIVPIAHANDGGGSIRIPAACNGLVGMKPTRGRTPTGPDSGIFLWGLAVEFALTRSVRDSAALLDAVSGPDDGYFYTAEAPTGSFLSATMSDPGSLRVGVIEQLPGCAKPKKESRNKLNETRVLLEGLGHTCETVKLTYSAEEFNESTIRLWATTLGFYMEQFSRMTGRKISSKTVEAVSLETYRYAKKLNAMELEWAMSAQNTVSRSVGKIMRDYDVLLSPVLARDVAKLGELNQNARGVDLKTWWNQLMHDYCIYTPLFNTTGQPAITLPLWQSKSGLPLSMQFAGRLGGEETLYSLANQLEVALPWANRRPPNYVKD